MKTFAFVLLCALAAVQGRHTALQSSRTAALGENPWLVHLRIAVGTSGLLNTGAGTLIDKRWVLTSAAAVFDARFIWLRYGVVNVINPTLVTEATNTALRPHPGYDAVTGENNIALISINRFVESNKYIAPISPIGAPFNGPATFCNFGENNDGAPGELLNCYTVGVAQKEDGHHVISNNVVQASASDYGAPLIWNGAQVGVLVGAGDGSALFLPTDAYRSWLEQETGLNLNPQAGAEVAHEAVRFIQ